MIGALDLFDIFSNTSPIKYKSGGNVLLAPNGKPSNLTPEQYKLVRTSAFKAWFGDWENNPENASKVVDENGEPLVVYHGTNNEFTIFNRSIETNYRGKFEIIVENVDVSKDEFKKIEKYNEEEGSMSPFYEFWFSNINWMPHSKYVIPTFLNCKTLYIDENGQGGQGSYNSRYGDGLKITNADGQQGVDYYVVSNSNQIKLADGTNTTFDGNNPDIRFENGGLIAPNGNPSNLTPEQYKLVRTPEFKAWFGDWENNPENSSKVVDENGEPLVLYHGTDSKWNVFDLEKIGEGSDLLGKGIYLTENKNVARFYANSVAQKRFIKSYEEGMFGTYVPVYEQDSEKKAIKFEVVYSFFANCKKILDVNNFSSESIEHLIVKSLAPIYGKEFAEKDVKRTLNFVKQNSSEILNFRGELIYLIQRYPEAKEEIISYIKSNYDCFIFNPTIEFEKNNEKYRNYVLFNPNQIKLADGTNTTFDGSNSDIRYSKGGRVPKDLDTNFDFRFGDKLKKSGEIIVAHSTSSNLLPDIIKNGLRRNSKKVWENTSSNKLFFEIEPTYTHYGENVYGWKSVQKHGGVPITLYVKVKHNKLRTDMDDADLGAKYRKNQKECTCDIPPEDILGLNFVRNIDIAPKDFLEFYDMFSD